MERLTKTYKDGSHAAADNLPCGENSWNYKKRLLESVGDYEDTGLTPEQIQEMDKLYAEKCKEVAELRSMLPPCKVGDTVYEQRTDRGFIQEYIITAIHIYPCGISYGWKLKDGKGICSNVNGFSDYAIGKFVFLTRAEAEQN